ncbi:MAG TPA: very short patch repair endonuclease [Opitutaceae bacterium]|nr:very short patch repair endonuclease [Opitutaceae bacterium]HME04822.1 very short patch repair endonuclease [Solirubrobacteraceae bacterium]
MSATRLRPDDYPHPSSTAVTATMKGNRRTGTRPELILRSALHARGLRFRKDYPARVHGCRPTRIDVAFTRARVAVFVDGCFWHGCPLHGNVPATNPHYWPEKLRRNRERDRVVTSSLERDGWTVLRLWEHVPLDAAVEEVVVAVDDRSGRGDDF